MKHLHEGQRAAAAGCSVDDNPYTPDSIEGKHWAWGFELASDDGTVVDPGGGPIPRTRPTSTNPFLWGRRVSGPGLVLDVWEHETEKSVRAFGPFVTLQDACDAVALIEVADGEVLLLNGTDEMGEEHDAHEPKPGDSAESMRAADERATLETYNSYVAEIRCHGGWL